MLANSLTVYRHPEALIAFVEDLASRGIAIINSAVFHAGFLVGGKFFDYSVVTRDQESELYAWREEFHTLCEIHRIQPSAACIQFALTPPGVLAISLNSSVPSRVGYNVAAVKTAIPANFWQDAKKAGLISNEYPYV